MPLTTERRDEIGEQLSRGVLRCISCDIEKLLSEFNPSSGNKLSGKQSYCKLCNHIKAVASRRANELGWTTREYIEAVKVQDGRCAICNNKDNSLCADHCHKSNKKRGLLCHSCNMGLGLFQDNVLRLESAILYLKAHLEI